MFAESVDGMSLQTLEAGETELDRLRKLKLHKMGDLIQASRTTIQGDPPQLPQTKLSVAIALLACVFTQCQAGQVRLLFRATQHERMPNYVLCSFCRPFVGAVLDFTMPTHNALTRRGILKSRLSYL